MEADLGRMPWRARVRTSDGGILGGGILLGTTHVLTCAHVLEAEGGPAARPLVDLVGMPHARPVGARVRSGGWVPRADDGRGDLALLTLDRPAPEGVGAQLHRTPVDLGRSVRLYGFPRFGEFGVWVRATITGHGGPGDEWVRLDVVADRTGPGFSGAPVLDDETGRLIGMLVAADRTEPGTAWMLPADTIVRHLPLAVEWVGTDESVLERLDRLVVRAGGRPSDRYDDLLVSLPKDVPADPLSRVLVHPHLPEARRFCVNCGRPVGRGFAGRPGRVEGFCSSCGTRFGFAPGLRPGELVAARYEVIGCIAYGGFGWIYLAADRDPGGGHVVLKGFIDTDDPEAGALAKAERRYLAELTHPNLVRVLGFADHPDPATGQVHSYLVMEYVSGPSLREVMRRSTGLRAEQVAAYGREILDALGYLHERGLLYCDMKPDNVIQTGDRVKVIDLGSVRRADDRVNPVYGTRGYQVDDQEIDRHWMTVRSDIHTVGATLRELLATTADRSAGVGTDSLRLLVDRATARYEDRFATAAEMADQLLGVLREILSLRDRIPRPATSTVFDDQPVLVDGGLGEVPAVIPWTDRRHWVATAACPPPAAAAAMLARTLPSVADATLVADWERGVRALADGRVTRPPFRRCYARVPGEPAPKLALGYCAEFEGRPAAAARYYEAVWLRDRSQIGAAFGLARVRLAGGDRVGAAAVLDDVPVRSRHFQQAQVAAIRALTAAVGAGAGAGLPGIDEVGAAVERISRLALAPDALDRLTTAVLEVALAVVTHLPEGAGWQLPGEVRTEAELRDRLAETYRRLAEHAAGPGWAEERRAVRAREQELRRERKRARPGTPLGFEVAVHQNKYLALDEQEMNAILSVRAVRAAADARLAVVPAAAHRIRAVRQVFPDILDLPEDDTRDDTGDTRHATGFALGSWRRGETREYQLTFAVRRDEAPTDEDVLLAEVTLTGVDPRHVAAGRSSHLGPLPILVHWTRQGERSGRADNVVARYAGREVLGRAVDTALIAYEAGERERARAALGAAVAMAWQQGDGEVLRRLRRVLDIVDESAGLVILKEPDRDAELSELELYSEQLARHAGREPAVVGTSAPTATAATVHRTGRLDSLRLGPRTVRFGARRGAVPAPAPEPPRSEHAAPGSGLRARVWCESDDAVVPGRPARVALAIDTTDVLDPLTEPVRLRVLLGAVPATASPVSRVAVLGTDRSIEPVRFDVVPDGPEPVPLVFRVYRDRDSQLLLEIRAELPVAELEVPT